VPAAEPRHPSETCPVLREAVAASGVWADRLQNNIELRTSTVRCTGGCWDAYERSEQKKIAAGDRDAAEDARLHGRESRDRFAEPIERGGVVRAFHES
jgi:hypothetical protein